MRPIKPRHTDLLETTDSRTEKDDTVAGSKIRCYYDGQRVLLEVDDSNNDERAYIYGNYIDEVLIMTDLSVQGEPDYYYAHDHLYSVVALFVDDDGPPDTIVTERYEYDAYGKVRIMDASYGARTSSSYDNPYYFTGRRRDALDTSGAFKIYYYRARYYDAETGRFLQRDPAQYVDGLNLYFYALNNPIGFVDAMGLSSYCGPLFGDGDRRWVVPPISDPDDRTESEGREDDIEDDDYWDDIYCMPRPPWWQPPKKMPSPPQPPTYPKVKDPGYPTPIPGEPGIPELPERHPPWSLILELIEGMGELFLNPPILVVPYFFFPPEYWPEDEYQNLCYQVPQEPGWATSGTSNH